MEEDARAIKDGDRQSFLSSFPPLERKNLFFLNIPRLLPLTHTHTHRMTQTNLDLFGSFPSSPSPPTVEVEQTDASFSSFLSLSLSLSFSLAQSGNEGLILRLSRREFSPLSLSLFFPMGILPRRLPLGGKSYCY